MKKKYYIGIAAVVFSFFGTLQVFAAENKKVDILFTHDLHSHLDGYEWKMDETNQEVGGFARLKTVIDQKKITSPNVLVVDGGDFSMGTLFQTIYANQAAELRMMGFLGYDATTLGNHEFDYRSKGLIDMLKAAKDSGETLPQILLSNVDWTNRTKEQSEVKEAFDYYGVKPYSVVEKGDVKIAIIGVFGDDSLACAPTCELKFSEQADAVKEVIAQIKETETVDMIVCLSHSGIWEDSSKSEDELLAKAVPEIDLIVSGHTHSILEKPIKIGHTNIVSCGEYGARIGEIEFIQNDSGRWDLKNYNLILLTEEIEEDQKTLEKIDVYRNMIDSFYLEQFGYNMSQVLTKNPYEFAEVSELEEYHREETIGNLLTDAFRYAVKKAEGESSPAVDVAILPSGVIRDTFRVGKITVADVFNVNSLGIGPDEVPGYPLVSVYFTGKELKKIAEIDASITPFMTGAQIYMSGLNFTFNPNRWLLNKVVDSSLMGINGDRIEIQDDKLYRVVSDLYTGQMLGTIKEMSFGIYALIPKDENGNPIENLEDHIIYEDGKELKAWAAVAHYLESFEKENGVAIIPAYYSETKGRKNIEDSRRLWELVKKPSDIVIAVIFLFTVIIGILIWIIVLYTKKRRKKE